MKKTRKAKEAALVAKLTETTPEAPPPGEMAAVAAALVAHLTPAERVCLASRFKSRITENP